MPGESWAIAKGIFPLPEHAFGYCATLVADTFWHGGIMESDKNTTNSISDEMRIKAENKQVTLQPLHEDIKADDIPDSERVAHHLVAGPIANSPNDTEQTDHSELRQQTDESSPAPGRTAAFIVAAIALCGVATVTLMFLTS